MAERRRVAATLRDIKLAEAEAAFQRSLGLLPMPHRGGGDEELAERAAEEMREHLAAAREAREQRAEEGPVRRDRDPDDPAVLAELLREELEYARRTRPPE